VIEVLGLPSGCGGGVVTGCTMANFSALAAARYALLERVGWDVVSKGLYGAPEIKVVVSDEVHASVLKALSLVASVVTAFTGYPGRWRLPYRHMDFCPRRPVHPLFACHGITQKSMGFERSLGLD
jgi:hypothetical protein